MPSDWPEPRFERLKQAAEGFLRNRLTGIRHREYELAVVAARDDPYRSGRLPVGEGVCQQVGQQLTDPRRVAADRCGEPDLAANVPFRLRRPHLVDDLIQHHAKAGVDLPVDRKLPAEPAAREVEHVVDHAGHARRAAVDDRGDPLRLVVEASRQQHLGAGLDRGERIAQVVAEHRDELLLQFATLAFVREGRFTDRQPLLRIEMEPDQVGEQLERVDRFDGVQARRPRIDGAQRAKELTARQADWHRDVALESVLLRNRVFPEQFVVRDMVDDHELTALANLVAERGLDLKLAAGLQAEIDLVTHRARDPVILGNPGDRREPHAGGPADHFQDGRNHVDPGDRRQIVVEECVHVL